MMQEYFFAERGIYYKKNSFKPGLSTLLFVHGLSGSSSAWALYEEKFEGSYNILSYDLRGHGKSDRFHTVTGYELRFFVQDLEALMVHVSIKKVFLIGHSFGSMIALDFTLAHPEKVEGLVLISPFFFIEKRWLSTVIAPFFTALNLITKNWKPGKKNHIDYSLYKNTGDWNVRRTFADIHNTGLHTYLSITRQICIYDRRNSLRKLTLPVLVIHGMKDSISPYRDVKIYSKAIKDMHLLPIPEGDHILVLNEFDRVSDGIENFASKACLPKLS